MWGFRVILSALLLSLDEDSFGECTKDSLSSPDYPPLYGWMDLPHYYHPSIQHPSFIFIINPSILHLHSFIQPFINITHPSIHPSSSSINPLSFLHHSPSIHHHNYLSIYLSILHLHPSILHHNSPSFIHSSIIIIITLMQSLSAQSVLVWKVSRG